jgi:hypothetical protein
LSAFYCNGAERHVKLRSFAEKADTRIKGGNVPGCPGGARSKFVTDRGGRMGKGAGAAGAAVTSTDKKCAPITAWTPGRSVLFNGENPCAHGDPYYGTIAPGMMGAAAGIVILTEEPAEKVVRPLLGKGSIALQESCRHD